MAYATTASLASGRPQMSSPGRSSQAAATSSRLSRCTEMEGNKLIFKTTLPAAGTALARLTRDCVGFGSLGPLADISCAGISLSLRPRYLDAPPATSKMSIRCDLEVPCYCAKRCAISGKSDAIRQHDTNSDALLRFNPVSREVLLACRLSHRSSRRLIPAGIRVAGETLAHF